MTEEYDTDTDDPTVQLSISLLAEWSARKRRRVEREATRLRQTIEYQLASGMTPEDVVALFREYGHSEHLDLVACDDGSVRIEVRDREPDDVVPEVRADGWHDLEERRTEALEEISAQLRYQNAAICELIKTVEHVGLASIGVEEPRSESRSYRALQTALEDHDFTRQEKNSDSGLSGFGGDFR